MTGPAKIFLLYTGGTVGMAPIEPGNPGSPLVAQPLDELLDSFRDLHRDPRFKLTIESFDQPLDSSSLGPHHWVEMAKRIEAVYDDHDGFVILHGTDTMAYTSSALAFMFEDLAKPVVLTGSQLPISHPRTDAVTNLVNAVHVAGYKRTGLPCIPEVVIVFADRILRGCRARKVSASSWAAFESPNFPSLGRIGEHIRIFPSLLRPMPAEGQRFRVHKDLGTRVLDLGLSPGLEPRDLERFLLVDDVDAAVLRTYGAGNAPDTPEFLAAVAKIAEAGKTLVNVTQCLEGTVEMGLYSASAGLLERGVISALDMTPEAALTKLMWSLATKTGDRRVVQMQVSQRGEQSQNLFDLRYGSCGSEQDPQSRFDNYVTPDRRLSIEQLERVVLRFSGLGPVGAGGRIRVFMNFPAAKPDTDPSHERCIADIALPADRTAANAVEVVDRIKARSLMGEGDVTLSVVSANPEQKFWFGGLYLAAFATA